MPFATLALPSDLDLQLVPELKDGDPAEAINKTNGQPVSKTRARFLAQSGGRVTFNSDIEVAARFWFNNTGGLDVNFRINEGCVEALDFPKQPQGINCPITVMFENPVKAVGAFVSVAGTDPADFKVGDPLVGHVLVELEDGSRQIAQPVVGEYGFRIAANARVKAPFVGCEVSGNTSRIKIARFDASAHHWFESVVISRLYYSE
jgi:hypothetical protein